MNVANAARLRLLLRVVFLCGSAIVPVARAHAQSPATIRGVVTDSSHAPIFEAIVELDGTPLRGKTDERGEFRIVGPLSGSVDIRVKRLGYLPAAQSARVDGNNTDVRVNIVLTAVPAVVKPVIVHASGVQFSGRLAGYYQRLSRRSNGQFISREEIDRRSNRSLSQLLSASPGVTGHRLRAGGGGVVRMRGRACRPLVWLDGVPMPAAEFDLDAIPTSTLHGVELYLGSTTAPSDYTASQGMSGCGTILLWSRGRDTELPRPVGARSVDVENLAAERSVFTADQVDTPAVLESPDVRVIYPVSLFASGIEGIAVAEFVVGATGKIQSGSFAIISATHPLFAEAVSRAMENVTYTPARKNGVAVRQVVHQRFEFLSRAPAKLSVVPDR